MQQFKSLKVFVSIAIVCFSCNTLAKLHAQSGVAGNKNYTVVVVEVQGSRVGFFNSDNGVKMGTVNIGFKPHEIEISKDGNTAYVTNFGLEDYDHRIGVPGNSISVIDIPRMKEKYRLSVNDPSIKDSVLNNVKGPHGVKLRPSKDDELFVNTEVGGDFMLVYDVKRRKLKRSYSIPAGTHNFIFSPDGQFLYLFSGTNGVSKVNPETGEILATRRLLSPVRGLQYTTDNRFIIATGKDEAVLLSPENLAIERHYRDLGVGQILYPKPTPDGKYILFPAVNEGKVAVLDIESGKIIHSLNVGQWPIAIAISPDGKKAYVSCHIDTYFSSIDLKTFEVKKFGDTNGSNGIGIGSRVKKYR